MNYVYCNDLQNSPVIGTFLELLYHLKIKNSESVTPIVVVGERDAIKIPVLKKLLSDKLGINNGIYKVNSEINKHEILNRKSNELLNKVLSIHDLKLLTYEEINIGTGIASSIISKHRCLEPDFSKIKEDVNSYTLQSILFLNSFCVIAQQYITKNDKIYIYNGRFYNTYPQTIFCEKAGFNIIYYERMNSAKNLRMHSTRIHDVCSTSRIIKKFWETATDPNKKENGEIFFKENMHNKFTAKFSEKIEVQKEIISFFTSSEDEYAALDSRIALSDVFDSQRSAVEWLINWAAEQEKYMLIVRLHPNQEYICSKDYDYWHSLSGKNVVLIPSHSKISSYDIIRKSTKVVTFLSTIGIEATRMRKSSITIGNPVYKGMDAVYEPKTKDHLLQLLNKKIQPKSKENTLPYGYFNLCYGPQLQFMKVLGLSEFSQYSNILINELSSSAT